MDKRKHFSSGLFFALAAFLWASFIVLGVMANFYKGTDMQLALAAMCIMDGLTAIGMTVAATIFWLIDRKARRK